MSGVEWSGQEKAEKCSTSKQEKQREGGGEERGVARRMLVEAEGGGVAVWMLLEWIRGERSGRRNRMALEDAEALMGGWCGVEVVWTGGVRRKKKRPEYGEEREVDRRASGGLSRG